MNDLLVFPDRVDQNWWRDEAYVLKVQDLAAVFASEPKLLIVGTGYNGMMKVSQDVRDYCREHDVRLFEATTDKAVQEYNRKEGPGVVGAFHLT